MQTKARLIRLERLERKAVALTDCICFPPDEPPHLELKAEIEAARGVRCPLHGGRFLNPAPTIYRSPNFIRPAHLEPERWSRHSEQYVKAMKASFSPDRWPATRVEEPDEAVRFVLKDGTEIHRIAPPPFVYDLDTGEPCGRIGLNGKILPLLPLSPPTVEADVAPPKQEDEVLILDTDAEAVQPRKAGGVEILDF